MGTFDLTIRLGDILTMAGLLGGGAAVIFMMRADMRVLALRVKSIEGSIETLCGRLSAITEILVQQARHDQRLSAVEAGLRELRKPGD